MKKISFYFFIFIVLNACNDNSESISQWRGHERKGIFTESNLLKEWPESGPQLLWEYDSVGNGYGSPVFANDRFFIMGETDSIGYLYSFDLQGKLLWKKPYGPEWMTNYVGSHSSPTLVENLVYLSSGLGDLYCMNAVDGEKVWSVNLKSGFHGRLTRFGHSESPLVYKDVVYFTPGGADTNVVAMNRFTGQIQWINNGLGQIPGYNSPNLIQLPNRALLVTFSAYAFMGFDALTGQLLWVHEQTNTPLADRQPGIGDTHSNTAIFEDGFIYYVAGDGNGAVKLKLSDDGTKVEQVWNTQGIYNYMGGIVKFGNFIYSNGKNNLVSLNAMDGTIADSLKIGDGALISADGMLYYYNQRGEVILVQCHEGKMEQKGLLKMKRGTKEHFAHPVINQGIMYLRHGIVLQAYSISNK